MRIFGNIILLAYALSVLPGKLSAQTDTVQPVNGKTGKITGIALDSTSGLPVVAALVKLQEINDELLKYTETDASGTFFFEEIPYGIYEVQVVKDGYAPFTKMADLNSELRDLGTLNMNREIITEEITVEAQKPFMEIKDDKKIFNLENNVITEGKTAIEVLRTLPLVSVDADDNIMLRGDRRIKILINGKENRMYTSLRQVPADIIEKIELITTPSAKYEAEGVSGVINIILKKSYEGGYSGYLLLGGNTQNSYNSYGNFNAKLSKFSLFSRLGVGSYKGDLTNDFRRENFLNTPSVLTSNSSGEHDGKYLFGSLGAEYDISEQGVLGLDFTINGYSGNSITSIMQQYTSADSNSTSLFDNNYEYDGLNFNTSLYFNKKFDSTDHELNMDFSFGKNDSKNISNQEKLDAPPYFTKEDRKMISNTFAGQLDYIKPFGDVLKLEAGYKGTFNFNDNNIKVDSLNYSSGAFDPVPDRTQEFDYDSFVNGFYTTLSKNFSQFSIKLGARVEMTRTSIGSNNKSINEYTDIFPSASLTYKLGMSNTVQLSYTRRIERPRVWYLNPFVTVYNNQSIVTGNPDLSPEYTNSFEISVNSFIGQVSLSPNFYYKKTNNVITSYSFLTDTNTTVTTYNNSSELDSYGADLIFGGQLFGFINFNSSLNVSWLSYSGPPGASLNNEGTSFGGNAYMNIPLGDIVSIGMYYYRWGDGVTAQGTRKGKNFLSFSISKTFLDNDLRINLNVNDVLANVQRPESFTNGIGYTNRYTYDYKQQNVGINISYNFGNAKETQEKRRKKKTEQPQQQTPPDDGVR